LLALFFGVVMESAEKMAVALGFGIDMAALGIE
jgi:hypothetical protein